MRMLVERMKEYENRDDSNEPKDKKRMKYDNESRFEVETTFTK